MSATATTPDALGAHFVRQYCRCASAAVCDCDLPQRQSVWTVESLQQLRQRRLAGYDLNQAAQAAGVTLQECNQALDALLGRSALHALALLEAQAARR